MLETPLKLELSLKHYRPVELLANLPNVKCVNSHTLGFTGDDMADTPGFLAVVLNYSVDLQP